MAKGLDALLLFNRDAARERLSILLGAHGQC